jgi:hypothetical protein
MSRRQMLAMLLAVLWTVVARGWEYPTEAVDGFLWTASCFA